ncbi:MAG: hypothetical protein AVDCRST_MAG56-5255, partial [uncultured Cytophagales bacterium]
ASSKHKNRLPGPSPPAGGLGRLCPTARTQDRQNEVRRRRRLVLQPHLAAQPDRLLQQKPPHEHCPRTRRGGTRQPRNILLPVRAPDRPRQRGVHRR